MACATAALPPVPRPQADTEDTVDGLGELRPIDRQAPSTCNDNLDGTRPRSNWPPATTTLHSPHTNELPTHTEAKMRWLPAFLSAALLAAPSLAAKKSAEERFTAFHTKSLSSTPVKLRDNTYRELTGAPRDYTAAVLLTAMDARFGCQLCREFQPEWDLLSRSWTNGDKAGESRLVFGTLDFSDGRDVFMSLGLQTAPILLLFPPTVGPHAAASPEPIRYDFTNG